MFIRNKKTLRVISIFLLVNFLNSIFYPTVSYGLTSGPSQPEFGDYEEVSASDMVNLITGDFNYTIPIIEIPGAETSFSLPLSYHSGIHPEEDASWVGLGWSMNPGAITRSASQYPDDFAGESITSTVADKGGSGYSINIPLIFSFNHDSKEGNGGTIGMQGILSAGYGTANGEGSVLGIDIDHEHVKPDYMALSMIALTIITEGAGAIAEVLEVSEAAVVDAMEIVNATVNAASIPSSVTSLLGGSYNTTINDWTINSSSILVFGTNNYYLDATKTEKMYGSLYYGCQPGVSSSPSFNINDPNGVNTYSSDAVSDMYMNVDNSQIGVVYNPSNIANDIYNVKGQGISGSITPYHYETGSLSFYRSRSNNGDGYPSAYNYAPFPFSNPIIPGTPYSDYRNKVRYRYQGDNSSYYNYHSYNNDGSSGMSFDVNTRKYSVSDPSLTDGAKRMEGDRRGFTNKKLIQGRNIEWFSNAEISTMNSGIYQQNTPFIDFLNISTQNGNPSRTAFRQSCPQKGIGGYVITRADGTTYYYALPVYNKTQNMHGRRVSDASKTNSSTMNAPYAYEWLLTGITGPDFVDRGEIGVLDDKDWGSWTKLEYGKFSSNYNWHLPYYRIIRDQHDGPESIPSNDSDVRSYTDGTRESYYLDKISTRTHTAIFVKELRNDGRGFYDVINTNSKPSSSLQLSEIILMNNNDYNDFTISGFGKNTSNMNADLCGTDSLNTVFDKNDISTAQRTFIDQHQLKKVVFNYDYSLCPGTTNSFASASLPPRNYYAGIGYMPNGLGKLSLKSVNVYGQNNANLFPPYTFAYNGANPNYDPDHWDGWGMNKMTGSYSSNGHRTTNGSDGIAWNLTDITTPTGGTISVTYERDNYYSVSGNLISESLQGMVVNTISNTILAPTGVNLNEWYQVGQTVVVLATIGFYNRVYDSEMGWQCIFDSRQATFYFTIGSISTLGDVMNINENMNSSFLSNVNQDGDPMFPVNNLCPTPPLNVISIDGVVSPPHNQKFGGDVRVSQIRASDGSNTYKTNYVYTLDGSPTGISSGVVAQEPDYIKQGSYPQPFETDIKMINDYPFTSVMYNKVTVYNGKLSTWNDYVTGMEYIFTTPHYNMLTRNQNLMADNFYSDYYGTLLKHYYKYEHYKLANNVININTSKIGSIQSIRSFDKTNTISKSVFNYNSNPTGSGQGKFTEGSINYEKDVVLNDNNGNYDDFYKLVRTTKTYNPNILASIVTTNNNYTSTVQHTGLDLYTAEPLEKRFTNSLGVNYISIDLPAYQVYPEMSSKALNTVHTSQVNTYKNMMSQKTAHYLFKGYSGVVSNFQADVTATSNPNEFSIHLLNGNTFPPNYGIDFGPWIVENPGGYVLKPVSFSQDRQTVLVSSSQALGGLNKTIQLYPNPLVSASIQTWDNNWNYRLYNTTTQMYDNAPISNYASIGGVDPVNPSAPSGWPLILNDNQYGGLKVFRKKANYVWKSPLLNQDGTYQNYVDFNWTAGANVNGNWQKAAEIQNYDQFTKTLETKDINGNFSSMKLGYDLKYPIISGANARYSELAYSGAEDKNSNPIYGDINHFGTEVDLGTGTLDPLDPIAHTGTASLKLLANPNQDPNLNPKGFTFKAKLGTYGVPNPTICSDCIDQTKKYRASVWIYDNGNTTANLYYKLQNSAGADVSTPYQGNISLSNAPVIVKAGKWKLLNLDIVLNGINATYNNYILVIGCTNPNVFLPAYFDDFRFHPLSTTVSTSVYDKQRGLLTHTLDGDNFYTRYAYDDQGRVIGIYKETIKGEIKQKQYDYNYAH